jgi:oxygen-independent coproporphyrinogen-3 oxidase
VFDRFGLYVHVPYCRTHCPYCDFNVVVTARWPERHYTDALVAELRQHAQSPPFRDKRLASIFFGGGTPSLFTPDAIGRVIREAKSLFPTADDAEVSLEANPETVSAESLAGYRRAGINRISFGIESFRPVLLKRLARLQTAAETTLAVPMARAAGFDNVAIDLMFAIPGQSLADWREDLDKATAQRPEHVSAYNLTYEEGTPFFELRRRGRLVALDDDLEAAMFEEARARLGRAGYRAYEVSNFALPGFESRHNLNYWQAGAYLGIGAGAHSHAPLGRRARRWSNERDPEEYVRRISSARDAVVSREVVEPQSAAGEYVFLHLRTTEGLAEEGFRTRFGATLEETFPELRRMLTAELLERTAQDRIALTRRGLLVADSVFASFL